MDPQIFLQCNFVDVRVHALSPSWKYLGCWTKQTSYWAYRSTGCLKRGQRNWPLCSVCTPSLTANLTILLLSLMSFFCCWHIWKPFLLCEGVCVCALGGCVRALLGGACVTWYGLSQYAAGGLKQEIHLSFWLPKRWHLNLGYPRVGLFFSAHMFRGSIVSPHQTGWLGLTAIHRSPPAAQVRGCAEVRMSPLGYYVHATLIRHNCSSHPEVKQM